MFVDIEIKENVISMEFGAAIPTDNLKTVISKSFLKSVSLSKLGESIVTLQDGRTWELSSVPEMIEKTFPINKWNGVPLTSNQELFDKIESIII